MHHILISCQEAFVAAIPLIPIFHILNRLTIRNRSRSLVYLILAIYLATMYAAVGLPDVTYFRYSPRFNFVPFLYMFSAWDTTLLNVVLFLPLGFLMPVLWKNYVSAFNTIFLGFLISMFIEWLQIFTYRATDINDLITNTLGTILGYFLGIATLKVFPAIKPEEKLNDLYLIFGTVFLVMFFIYPFLSYLLR